MTARTFDRTTDVAKLIGCNTRNVEYRWSIFERHLKRIPTGAAVLDFGAGSLRETYELTSLGFNVTAIDNNAATLASFYADYQWPRKPELIVGTDLSSLHGRKFALVTAFDVLEHLHDPAALLSEMRSVMADRSLIFCTVPNRRTIYEIAFRLDWKLGLAMGRAFTPGEPHIQFKSPNEWRELFRNCGLTIVEHEMAIGFFVNNWCAMVDVPSRLLGRVKRGLRIKTDTNAPHLLTRPSIMAVLDALDRRTKRLSGLYGWNLFVLQPQLSFPTKSTGRARALSTP
jgi:SAM-dependent methyltransferase